MRTRRTLVVTLALLAASAAAPRLARAADPQAEVLYQEGRHAAQSKDWETACARFRESQAREPAPGTLLNLADCEENRGHLRDALAAFEAAGRLFRPGDERASYAKQRSAALERRVPRLTLRLPGSAPEGAVVERDGEVVPAAALGAAVAVDPGEHTFTLRAPGRSTVKGAVKLAEGEARDVELSVGSAHAESGAASSAPSIESGSGMRTAGYVGLGVGAVGIVLGTIGGLLTMSAKSTVDANCSAACNPEGMGAQSRGKTWSAVSTVSFAAGALGLATGGALLLLAPSRGGSAGVGVGAFPGGAGVRLAGVF